MFENSHIKNAKYLVKSGVRKFLNYKKDIISDENRQIIADKTQKLRQIIDDKSNISEIKKVSKELTQLCERSVPATLSNSSFAENVEVLFVALILAIGIKTFFVQPFKIPTSSMHPTLYGITPEPIEATDELEPTFIKQLISKLITGQTYINIKFPKDEIITKISGGTYYRFFPKTYIHTRSGKKYKFSCRPQDFIKILRSNEKGQLIFKKLIQEKFESDSYNTQRSLNTVKKDVSYGKAYIQTGDQVFVNKMSYHFRKPKLGEVFVFKTTMIRGIENRNDFKKEYGSQHYIKRLCALPSSTLEFIPPHIKINGKIPQNFGMQRVMSEKNGYDGYKISVQNKNHFLKTDDHSYIALGDNTDGSFDSRDWGTIDQRNLVGSAVMVYWPITKRWGPIK